MGDVVIGTVWFLSAENSWDQFKVRAYDDEGVLIVRDGELEFRGRTTTVAIRGITRISLVRQGRDFVNQWVKVEYLAGPDPSVVYFADGSILGWGGVLGGTKRLYAAIEDSLRARHSDPAAVDGGRP